MQCINKLYLCDNVLHLLIYFKVESHSERYSHDCRSTSDVTLIKIGWHFRLVSIKKIIKWYHWLKVYKKLINSPPMIFCSASNLWNSICIHVTTTSEKSAIKFSTYSAEKLNETVANSVTVFRKCFWYHIYHLPRNQIMILFYVILKMSSQNLKDNFGVTHQRIRSGIIEIIQSCIDHYCCIYAISCIVLTACIIYFLILAFGLVVSVVKKGIQ